MTAIADLQTTIGDGLLIFNEDKKFVISNAKNYAAMEAVLLTAYGTTPDALPQPAGVISAMRSQVFSFGGFVTPFVRAHLPALARIIGTVETDERVILRKWYEYMDANTLSVKTRTPTFGAVSAGTNVGTGLLTRLTKDRRGYNIESGSGEAKAALCVQDEYNGGTRHRELFQLRGAAIVKTDYPMPGQGSTGFIRVLSIEDSRAYLRNPGFEEGGGDGSSAPTGWTMGTSAANVILDGTNYYKDVLPSSATPYGLKFTASDSIKQVLVTNGATFQPYTPIYAQLSWMRLASATGNLKLKIGGIEVTVTIGSGTNGVWNVLKWPINGTPDKTAYPEQWNATNAEIKVTVDTLATGTVVIDEVICAPYTNFDGTWYALNGGTTPFLAGQPATVGDSFSWTDSYVGAVVQEWLSRAYPGFHLPPNAIPTWADPT